jgi:redox-sensing transcriptional repressor
MFTRLSEDRLINIPLPSLRRLPRYLNVLETFQARGKTTVSATDIAEELDLKPIQIRKDMAFTGIVGKPKVGYDIHALISAIRNFIGWSDTTPAVLIGAGSLGTALLGYEGFRKRNLKIVAAFDINPSKQGTVIYNTMVHPMENLERIVTEQEVRMAIITVPSVSAQAVTDALIRAGIVGIWNFSPAEIQAPPGISIRREDLSEGLAVLFVQMQEKQFSEPEDEPEEK